MPTTPTAAPPPHGGRCPKSMTYGPCGGVHLDGSCEVADHPCTFLGSPPIRWAGVHGGSTVGAQVTPPGRYPTPAPTTSAGGEAMRALLRTRPIVVVDFPAAPLSTSSIADCAGALRGRVDAVLAADSGPARLQFPPAFRAERISAAGIAVWSGLNNRDRNRVALESELAALSVAGVAGVHCVTGDHPLVGSRPEAEPVFDLDSTETATLARHYGHLVSVAESPCAPTVANRPSRLLQKQRAGAEICYVNHAGGAGPVREFLRRCREIGVEVTFVICVPVVLDAASAALMRSFPTSPMPPDYVDRIMSAPDPRRAGIRAATVLAQQMLELGVGGVNLSGGPGPGDEVRWAAAAGTIADALGLDRTAAIHPESGRASGRIPPPTNGEYR